MARIGVIGLGGIGRGVVEYATSSVEHELAFARNRSHSDWATQTGVPVLLGPPTEEELRETDLVVEAAHPEVVEHHGERILRHCDFLVVSAGALADESLLSRLTETAREYGTNVIVPQGALVGVHAMLAQSKRWTRAQITMIKSPDSLDPAPDNIDELTVLYEGAVGPLIKRYPRNVNAMVAFALATLGLEKTIAKLVCDPAADLGHLEIELESNDGAFLFIQKAQPMHGISGSEMTQSILQSVSSVTGASAPGLRFA